jgi:hypothetical protein
MILNAKTGRAMVRDGKARFDGTVIQEDSRYAIITTYDPQRTDHYPLKPGEDK